MTDQPDPLRIDFHLLDRQIVDGAENRSARSTTSNSPSTRQPGDCR